MNTPEYLTQPGDGNQKGSINRGRPRSQQILSPWLENASQWLHNLKHYAWRLVAVALLTSQMAACQQIIGSGDRNPSPNDKIFYGDVFGKKDVSFDLSKLLISEHLSTFDLLDLSLALAKLEEELSSPVGDIKKEDLINFSAELTPKILEIYKERNLSWGVWIEDSFRSEDRTNEIPDFRLGDPNIMAGTAAKTNYRKGTIVFNENLFNSNGECSLGTVMFLLAHELAHFSGTTDELYKRDDPTNESAAQLAALEALAYGYFKYREKNPQVALWMLIGFVRTLRAILENATLYNIINENEDLALFKDYLKNLPNPDERKKRLESFSPMGNNKAYLGKQIAYYYGELPLNIMLGKRHQLLLYGNRQRSIGPKSTERLLHLLYDYNIFKLKAKYEVFLDYISN